MNDSELARTVVAGFSRAAQESRGWESGVVKEEVTPGRYRVELENGANVVLSVTRAACFRPTVDQEVDLSRVNGLLGIEGPSGYG